MKEAARPLFVRSDRYWPSLLDVPSPVGIPEEFDLVVSSDALRFACRVVWRKAARIGIRFD
jgi:hypothetical protein